MPLKIVHDGVDNSIQILKMKPGQYAQIVRWEGAHMLGVIVLRCYNRLVRTDTGNFWDKIPNSENCRVEILPSGTILQVTNNE